MLKIIKYYWLIRLCWIGLMLFLAPSISNSYDTLVIIVLTVQSINTTQIFVPTLEENMLDKSKFHCMLNWSHIAAAVFKALFGYIGFVTFQEDTQEEVKHGISPG